MGSYEWALTTRSTGRKSRYAVFAPVTSGVRHLYEIYGSSGSS
jgi:hypothetical protein